MERPPCDELAVMLAGSRYVLAVRDRTSEEIRTHESGFSDAHGMRVENRTHERGYSDAYR